ncbi:MAG: ATP-dependent helicase [Lachnospiraceae bacterium]|nr:ATP-dependent helicase [Lachnospiraceae bacterium]
MQFNKEQLMAVNHFRGPALIVAGPGSGKTTTLIHRVKTLIEVHGVDPSSILVITFSRSAAQSMRSRFNELCHSAYPVELCTFHSFFFSVIHRIYHFNTSDIITNKQKRDYLKQSIRNTGITDLTETEFLDDLLKVISYYKNSGETEYNDEGIHLSLDDFLPIYREYRHIQKIERKIDFEDMMLIVRDLFNKRTDILDKYRDRYTYILIDEFQDINPLQYEIVGKLVGHTHNLYVVGDDDQSIYGFRGSDPGIMLDFERQFPTFTRIDMSVNYRCPEEVIDAARCIISDNKIRFDKDIRGDGHHGVFRLMGFRDRGSEDNGLAELIKDLLKEIPSAQICILQRKNSDLVRLYSVLHLYGISASIQEKVNNPYRNHYIKDMLHYMNCSEDIEHMPIEDFVPIMNKPLRYIGREQLPVGYVSMSRLTEIYKDKAYMQRILKKLKLQLEFLSSLDLYSSIQYIRKSIGYDEYMEMRCRDDKEKTEEYRLKLDEIMDMAGRQLDRKGFADMLETLENLSVPREKADEEEGVILQTFHASKGLQYKVVIIPHINEGSIPGKQAVGEAAIEEERRMLYVAMTRAEERLYMTYVSGSDEKEAAVSRFIRSLISKQQP